MWRCVSLLMLYFSFTGLYACSSDLLAENREHTADSKSQMSVAVPYRLANNYFIKNNIKNKIPLRISSPKKFKQYFGEAVTMGKAGKPSTINFNQEDVVVYDAGVVQQEMQITPIDLRQSGQELHLILNIKTGAAINYSIHPFLLLITPKNQADKLIVHLQQEPLN